MLSDIIGKDYKNLKKKQVENRSIWQMRLSQPETKEQKTERPDNDYHEATDRVKETERMRDVQLTS